MASHARPRHRRRVPLSALRVGLALSVAGTALVAAGAAPAGAAAPGHSDKAARTRQAVTGALLHSLAGGLGPVKKLKLDPLSGTAADPLNNTIGTQIADFKPLTTGLVTGPLAGGGALEDLPLAGAIVGLLPG
ncbi:hypothetical protein DMH18_02290 [Streptomyces sp. WAC 06783]|uniref:hypothetical protein n=1 Tax=Streptomyces sp. WAC 06783 TaxID=2203211 RepID=UPI000F7406EF|nr:hypothetical protein [Streptomyces sp. WAC 06783]RSO13786.1 hypothetical protein DMH18_02290 [Streptomyces sp. WAC 06783]